MWRACKTQLSIIRCTLAAVVLGSLLIPLSGSGQRAESSLTDSDIENSELRVTLDQILGENRQLRDALSNSEASAIEMRKTLAATNGEAEVFRRQALELKKRFEALGASASGDTKKLEQRLLAAVNDLQQVEAEKKRLTEAVIRLSEAVMRFSKTATSSDAEARLILESEIRNANQALGLGSSEAIEGTPIAQTLTDGMVISVRDELALVVANLGQKQGVRIGMPFQVIRNDKLIGTVRVVEVREKFAGAVIQDLSSEKDRIKVGDRLKVLVQP